MVKYLLLKRDIELVFLATVEESGAAYKSVTLVLKRKERGTGRGNEPKSSMATSPAKLVRLCVGERLCLIKYMVHRC